MNRKERTKGESMDLVVILLALQRYDSEFIYVANPDIVGLDNLATFPKLIKM